MSVLTLLTGIVGMAVVSIGLSRVFTSWAGPDTAEMQSRLRPDVEPWSEEKRRKHNRGVVVMALLYVIAGAALVYALLFS